MATVERRITVVRVFGVILCLILAPRAWPQPVSITFTELTQFSDDIDGFFLDGPVGDFYAKVTIDGVLISTESDNYDFGFELGTGFIFPFTLRPDLEKDWQIVSGNPAASVLCVAGVQI
jgi:hypothetical protein